MVIGEHAVASVCEVDGVGDRVAVGQARGDAQWVGRMAAGPLADIITSDVLTVVRTSTRELRVFRWVSTYICDGGIAVIATTEGENWLRPFPKGPRWRFAEKAGASSLPICLANE